MDNLWLVCFFSSRRRHTRCGRDWSSDVCSSDLCIRPTTDRCYYIPARELGDGRRELRLRVTPAKNNQQANIRYAGDYLDLCERQPAMEPAGFEPATFRMQTGRSAS